MNVKVCDALCGSGKTVSCINMMNSDTDRKYIFITPYLSEVERIRKSCVSRNFVSPQKTYENGFSKIKDLPHLLETGRNIVSTHALFSTYTEEIKDLIRKQGYILVLDEVIDLFQPVDIDRGDIEFLKRNRIATEDGDSIIWEDDDYDGAAFSDVMRLSKSRDMINYDGSFYFWSLQPELFKCFSEAYVLTYMFEYQFLKYFFDVNQIEYELIGTTKKNGTYQFCPLEEMDRRRDIASLITIEDRGQYNEIGAEPYSLSSGWFARVAQGAEESELKALQNNLYNIFRHQTKKFPGGMWTTLNKYKRPLKGKGYAMDFVTFNKRASNDFADRRCLAYCLNLYMMPWMKNYLTRIGSKDISQDMWALSSLIQWIFRSAIRNGEKVYLYIPSKRMRFLLEEWLKNIAEGRDLDEITFKTGKMSILGDAAYKLNKSIKQRRHK